MRGRIAALGIGAIMLLLLIPPGAEATNTPTNLAFQASYSYQWGGPGRAGGHADDGDPNGVLLTDGIATVGDYNDGTWVIWDDLDARITMDLGSVMTISKISIAALSRTGFTIGFPVEFWAETSMDNVTYTSRYDEDLSLTNGNPTRVWILSDFTAVSTRYVRVTLWMEATTRDIAINEIVVENRAQTGANMESTFSSNFQRWFTVDEAVYGMTVHNGTLWASHQGSDTINEYDLTTGTLISTMATRDMPNGLVWDSVNYTFWYYGVTDALFVAIAENGTEMESFAVAGVIPNEDGLEWNLNGTDRNLLVVSDVTELVEWVGIVNQTAWTNATLPHESEGITWDGSHWWVIHELPDVAVRYTLNFTEASYATGTIHTRTTAIAYASSLLYISGEAASSDQIAVVNVASQGTGIFDIVSPSNPTQPFSPWGLGAKNGTGNDFGPLDTDPPSALRTFLVLGPGNESLPINSKGFALFTGVFTDSFDLNFTILVESWPGFDQAGFVFGWQNASNYNFLRLDYTNNRLWRGRVLNGTSEEAFTASFTLTLGTTYTFRVVQNGTSVEVYHPGNLTVPFLSYETNLRHLEISSPWTFGRLGFGHMGIFELEDVDLFIVTTPASPTLSTVPIYEAGVLAIFLSVLVFTLAGAWTLKKRGGL